MPATLRPAPGYEHHRFSGLDREAAARVDGAFGCPALTRPIAGSIAAEDALADQVLQYLKKQGVDYADLRLGRDLNRLIETQDNNISNHVQSTSEGLGVRVLYQGFWGFAASGDLSSSGILTTAARALQLARSVAQATPREFGLAMERWANEPAHRDQFDTPVAICPYTLDTNAAAQPLLEASAIALCQVGIKRTRGMFIAHGRRRLFASSEGARIRTTHAMTDSELRLTAIGHGTSAYRTLVSSALAGGFEHIIDYAYPQKAEAAAAEAVAKCSAKQPAPGHYDLILDPSNLALTMHESIGHPTELDRVLGYELGFAGGSYASLDKLGRFAMGSPLVNFRADNTVRFGAASTGYDDEGVACQSFDIVRDGVLVGYGNNRETASQMGLSRSNGTCRSTSWNDAPIVRIPNLYLEPSPTKLSLEDLIADTRDGILLLGRDSFSIDQMRYNFQFGSDMAYRIRHGRIEEPLRDVIYQSISPEFWGSMDAVCDAREFRMHGFLNCGKGQPMQLGKMMHGAAPARFRGIRVGY